MNSWYRDYWEESEVIAQTIYLPHLTHRGSCTGSCRDAVHVSGALLCAVLTSGLEMVALVLPRCKVNKSPATRQTAGRMRNIHGCGAERTTFGVRYELRTTSSVSLPSYPPSRATRFHPHDLPALPWHQRRTPSSLSLR